MSSEDFVTILTEGLSLEHFGFDDHTLSVFIKALVQSLLFELPDLSVYRLGNEIHYYGGSIFIRMDTKHLCFRMTSEAIMDNQNAGRFSLEAIKFVADASMLIFEDDPFVEELSTKKETEPSPKDKDEMQEEDSEDWWL